MVYWSVAQPYPHMCYVCVCQMWLALYQGRSCSPRAAQTPAAPGEVGFSEGYWKFLLTLWFFGMKAKAGWAQPPSDWELKIIENLDPQCLGNHCSSGDSCANSQHLGSSYLIVCRGRDTGRFQGCIWEGWKKKSKPRSFGAIGWDSFSLGT